MRYASMSPEAKDRYLRAHPACEICGTVAVVIDHDHATGLVRGALCRRCNGTLGSLEAALRVPTAGPFQSLASDLHHRLQRDGAAPTTYYADELAYLGLTAEHFRNRLQQVHDQLVVPCAYWSEVTGEIPGRATEWTKTGPLPDSEEAERQLRRLQVPARVPPHLWIVVAYEPDDGVNSPRPRGLVTWHHTEGAIEASRTLRGPADMSAWEAKCRDFVELAVPVLLSRELTPEQIRAATWHPRACAPRTAKELRDLIGSGYAPRWVHLAVRIAVEDLVQLPPARRAQQLTDAAAVPPSFSRKC